MTGFDFADPELREPIEVWLAACGNQKPLAKYLASEEPISNGMRQALAALHAGMLVPRKIKGRPKKRSVFAELDRGNSVPLRLMMAIDKYQRLADALRLERKLYGRSQELVECVAREYDLTPDQVTSELRRAKKKPAKIPSPQIPSDPVEWFQKWYDRIGDYLAEQSAK